MPSISTLKGEVQSLKQEVARATGQDDVVVLVQMPGETEADVIGTHRQTTGRVIDPASRNVVMLVVTVTDDVSKSHDISHRINPRSSQGANDGAA